MLSLCGSEGWLMLGGHSCLRFVVWWQTLSTRAEVIYWLKKLGIQDASLTWLTVDAWISAEAADQSASLWPLCAPWDSHSVAWGELVFWERAPQEQPFQQPGSRSFLPAEWGPHVQLAEQHFCYILLASQSLAGSKDVEEQSSLVHGKVARWLCRESIWGWRHYWGNLWKI